MLLPLQDFAARLNQLGADRIPFFFMIDFAGLDPKVFALESCYENGIHFDFLGFKNANPLGLPQKDLVWDVYPDSHSVYKQKFEAVITELRLGNSFLLNLTASTPVGSNLGLADIYNRSKAKYKLFYKNRFVFFSPETFIKIVDGQISTYPMKGTIDADLPDAAEILLNDHKEMAEHATIVDLLRNDLSLVASGVEVRKYRYLEKVQTHNKSIIQASSEIVGNLPADYCERIGSIICTLLPAGSISGAPKKKTYQLINEIENYNRGYYTGICGIFDGQNLDTAVMIRFVEQTRDGLLFKSGGGITAYSELEKEYQELIQKVYVPIY
jgi:para-aminobenzoate synthetase component I